MYRMYGSSGAMDGKERYVQDVRSVFLFPTKTKYLPPCKQVAVPWLAKSDMYRMYGQLIVPDKN